jgi:hypothetical protein
MIIISRNRKGEVMKKAMGVAAIFVLVVTTVASAGVNSNAKVAIHVLQHTSRSCSKNFPTLTDQSEIIVTEPTLDVDAFPVFFDLVEYQGFDYGMTWPGAFSCIFTSCSDFTIGTIQYPGDGISHAWFECKESSIAIPGFGWIEETAACQIHIISHPTPTVGGIVVGDCQEPAVKDTIPPERSYYSGIGGEQGQPTAAASWGQIKAMFK